jgi:hypothetical protein
MHILYLDASGDAGQYTGKNSKFYVLAGMAVKPDTWDQTKRTVEGITAKHFAPNSPPSELHASPIMNQKPPFNKIQPVPLMDEVYTLITKLDFTLFAVVVDKVKHWKQYVTPFPPQDLTLDQMVSKFEWFLERTQDVGIIVYDKAGGGYDSHLLLLFERFRRGGTTFKKPDRIMDTVFFTASETAIFLQLVDFCAYAVYCSFEHPTSSDPRYSFARAKYGQISVKFDKDKYGNLVGLKQYP